MICENCKNEIGDRIECTYCGFDPTKDKGNAVVAPTDPVLPPVEINIKKRRNGLATAGMILSFFSWYPLIGIPSFIFSLIGLLKAKRCRSGHVRAIIGLVLTLIFVALYFFLFMGLMNAEIS